jgi:hypothetical protein
VTVATKFVPQADPSAPLRPACPFRGTRTDSHDNYHAFSCLGPDCSLWLPLDDDPNDGDCAFTVMAMGLTPELPPEPVPWVLLSASAIARLNDGKTAMVPSSVVPQHCPDCGLLASDSSPPVLDEMIHVQVSRVKAAPHMAILTKLTRPGTEDPS